MAGTSRPGTTKIHRLKNVPGISTPGSPAAEALLKMQTLRHGFSRAQQRFGNCHAGSEARTTKLSRCNLLDALGIWAAPENHWTHIFACTLVIVLQ
jgi:hypothetical protein